MGGAANAYIGAVAIENLVTIVCAAAVSIALAAMIAVAWTSIRGAMSHVVVSL